MVATPLTPPAVTCEPGSNKLFYISFVILDTFWPIWQESSVYSACGPIFRSCPQSYPQMTWISRFFIDYTGAWLAIPSTGRAIASNRKIPAPTTRYPAVSGRR